MGKCSRNTHSKSHVIQWLLDHTHQAEVRWRGLGVKIVAGEGADHIYHQHMKLVSLSLKKPRSTEIAECGLVGSPARLGKVAPQNLECTTVAETTPTKTQDDISTDGVADLFTRFPFLRISGVKIALFHDLRTWSAMWNPTPWHQAEEAGHRGPIELSIYSRL